MSGNEAYATALERAKQIVSKFSVPEETQSNNGVAGVKRPAQDANSYPTSEKRPFVNDKTVGAVAAAAVAAEAAARINQKIAGAPPPIAAPMAGRAITAETSIPDRFVGLVIGKKGEQITQLQNDSNCKVQISQEGGRPERVVTLTGTTQQVEHAKQLLAEIIDKAERAGLGASAPGNSTLPDVSSYPSGPITTIELMVPGSKAGLVIGKSGETIKQLQEDNNVKMVLIQQSNTPTLEDKPLRISGEAMRVEKAKQQVMEIITAREVTGRGRMTGYTEGQELSRYAVPAEKAGLVIGKGGESIKEICRVSGSHVEISKEPPPDHSIKIFNIRGNRSEIEQAIRMISERAGIPMTRPAGTSPVPAPWGQYGYQQADPWSAASNGAAVGTASLTSAGMPPPSYNPYTGQPDYTAAWVEYYRRQGMHDYADAIQRQAQQQAGGAPPAVAPTAAPVVAPVSHPAGPTAVAPAQPQPNTSVVPSAPSYGAATGQPAGAGQYDYGQWQQWQQWQAWQQQAWQQQQGGASMGQPGGAMPQPSGAPPPGSVGGALMAHAPQPPQ